MGDLAELQREKVPFDPRGLIWLNTDLLDSDWLNAAVTRQWR